MDTNETTLRFRREIYDDQGKLVETQEEFPVDKGHQKAQADAHAALDTAVLTACGFSAKNDLAAQLLGLTQDAAANIEQGEPLTAPGVPKAYPDAKALVTEDCIQPQSTAYPPRETPSPTPLRQPIPEQAEAQAAHFYSGIIGPERFRGATPETQGQLLYEWTHLRRNLAVRCPQRFHASQSMVRPEPHPLFRIIPRAVREGERIPGGPSNEA